jgi:hypothetical protein
MVKVREIMFKAHFNLSVKFLKIPSNSVVHLWCVHMASIIHSFMCNTTSHKTY